jgi:hypothetical protein
MCPFLEEPLSANIRILWLHMKCRSMLHQRNFFVLMRQWDTVGKFNSQFSTCSPCTIVLKCYFVFSLQTFVPLEMALFDIFLRLVIVEYWPLNQCLVLRKTLLKMYFSVDFVNTLMSSDALVTLNMHYTNMWINEKHLLGASNHETITWVEFVLFRNRVLMTINSWSFNVQKYENFFV